METALTTNPRVPLGTVPAESNREFGQPQEGSAAPPSSQKPVQVIEGRPPASRRWLGHIAILLFVFFCSVVGLWLALLPWSLQWTDNPMLWTHPDLRAFLGYGFVRGICSGLGLLDLWIGIREATDYYEKSAIPK
jgi:hypothetical protein